MFLILLPRQLIFLHDRESVGLTADYTRKGSTEAGGGYRGWLPGDRVLPCGDLLFLLLQMI